jgi:uncharacterized protein (DUF433 family)
MAYPGNMSTPKKEWKYLAPRRNSSKKQLYMKGRGISARTLYGKFMSETSPMTPEEIAADYSIPLEVVLEAIEYCQSDPPEIREDFAREEALLKAIGRHEENYDEHGPSKLLTPQDLARLRRGENLS